MSLDAQSELSSELITHIQLAIIATALSFVALRIARRLHFFEWEKRSPISISVKTAVQLFVLFLSFQILFFPLAVSLGFLLAGKEVILTGEEQSWYSLLGMASMAALLSFYAYLKWKELRPLFHSSQKGKELFLGAATWLIAFPVVMVFAELLAIILSDILKYDLTDQTAIKQIKKTLAHPPLFISMALAVTTLVPIMEEFLFRGVLQTALRAYLDVWQAIILSSVLFAAFHFSVEQGINNIPILFSLFLLSLSWGF